MSKRFSRTFGSYQDWKIQAGDTAYTRKIQRLYTLHPGASLSQLRRHSRKGEKPLGKTKRVKLPKISWDDLSPREMNLRERSLLVLAEMRTTGSSLKKASERIGIKPKTVIKHTGAFKKEGERWKPKRHDVISRKMRIYEHGKTIYIDVKDSRVASTIGKYNSAVGRFLETGDTKVLGPFMSKGIKDSQGRIHVLEVSPRLLHDIHERRPHEEFYTIYQEG